jgi:putative addiction module component (TIGR02574 family)
MDLKTLKLELLERIALIDDEARLLALKRLLDAPRGYGIPNEKLSVVKEGEETYPRIEDRSYSGEEVRRIFEEARLKWEEEAYDFDLSDAQVAELDRRDEEMRSGKVKGIPWEEVQRLLDEDRKGDRE